jgi:predicted Rossmann fold nucleotide-binding protein DprA/Smf involved in DNA uptake
MCREYIVDMARDEETGTYTEEFTDAAFLDALTNTDRTTQQVANEVGCAYHTAYERLSELAHEGKIDRREIGNSLLWSRDS